MWPLNRTRTTEQQILRRMRVRMPLPRASHGEAR